MWAADTLRGAAVVVAAEAAAMVVAGRAALVTAAVEGGGRAAAYVCSVGPCQKEIILHDTVLCDVTVQLIQTAHREHSCVCCLHTLPAISVICFFFSFFLLVIAIHLVNFMQHKSCVIIGAKQDQCYH